MESHRLSVKYCTCLIFHRDISFTSTSSLHKFCSDITLTNSLAKWEDYMKAWNYKNDYDLETGKEYFSIVQIIVKDDRGKVIAWLLISRKMTLSRDRPCRLKPRRDPHRHLGSKRICSCHVTVWSPARLSAWSQFVEMYPLWVPWVWTFRLLDSSYIFKSSEIWFEDIISIKPCEHVISFHVSFWASSKLSLTFTK